VVFPYCNLFYCKPVYDFYFQYVIRVLPYGLPETHTVIRYTYRRGSKLSYVGDTRFVFERIAKNFCLNLIWKLKLLKSTNYVTHQQVLTFNSCSLCPHWIYLFWIYLRANNDLCHLYHTRKQIDYYSQDEQSLLRGTNWVFKQNNLQFVFKGFICISL